MALRILGVVLSVLFTGAGTGLALIAAIGAQNAFILRQGVRGQRMLPIIAVCLASDVVAITAGVLGVGVLVEQHPAVLPVAQVLGGVYLLAFGLHAALRAWRPSGLEAAGGPGMSTRAAVVTALALTWLNPHFYLDAVLMLGTIANSFGAARWWFVAGTFIASTAWFFGLGYGARLLRGFFAKPSSWRVLDGLIAAFMAFLGITLLAH